MRSYRKIFLLIAVAFFFSSKIIAGVADTTSRTITMAEYEKAKTFTHQCDSIVRRNAGKAFLLWSCVAFNRFQNDCADHSWRDFIDRILPVQQIQALTFWWWVNIFAVIFLYNQTDILPGVLIWKAIAVAGIFLAFDCTDQHWLSGWSEVIFMHKFQVELIRGGLI